MYKVKVNEHLNFKVEKSESAFMVNGSSVELDEQALTHSNTTSVIYQNKSYNVEVVEVNHLEKTSTIKVNGNLYTVQVEDQFDLLLKQLGMDAAVGAKIREIKAPMPGLVLKIMVEEGAAVHKGDNLLVLEAMKMENILKSTTDGIIKKIHVAQGDKIEKNTVLLQFQ
jgi:biotin carboxyl carrier protein